MQPDVRRIGEALGLGGPHQPGELDRAGAGAGQGRRHALRDARGARRDRQGRADARRRRAARAAAGRCEPAGRDRPARIDRRRRRGGRRDRDGCAGARPAADAAGRRGHSPRCLRARSLCRRAPGGARARTASCAAPMPRARRAAASRRAGDTRQPAAHRRRRCRGRETADRAGHHPLLPDRALVARRGGTLRGPAGRDRAHRPRELDRAGADPEPRRRHGLLARLRPARARRDRRGSAAPRQARRCDPRQFRRGGRGDAARGPHGLRLVAIGALRGLPEPGAGRRGHPAHRRAEQGAALGGSSTI